MTIDQPTASEGEALVSIIMPSHNSARFIDETLQSVIDQTYANWELIVVDDRSADGTADIVARYAQSDDRIFLIHLDQNSGAAVARNTAITAARGRYIAFLDSDDLWHPDKLTRQISFMIHTGCPFTFGSYERINESGEYLGTVIVPPRTNRHRLLKANVIACLTAVYDREYFGRTLMPLIRKGQDYGLWLALLTRLDEARAVPALLGRYRVREQSISSNKFESSVWVWRVYRQIAGLHLTAAVYYFVHYAISGVFVRLRERVRASFKRPQPQD